MSTVRPEALLHFWFGDLVDGLASEQQRAKWFSPDASFDLDCQAYASSLDAARAGHLDHWLDTPTTLLAYVILCDQLPRNIFRGNRQAFAFDDLALAAAKQAVTKGMDRQLGWDERAFLYMPFEHSEHLLDQHTAVGLFSALRDASTGPTRSLMGNSLRFAQQHRDIIQRFGRFPHRNAVLGRDSSAEELAYVAQGDGFGQSPAK